MMRTSCDFAVDDDLSSLARQRLIDDDDLVVGVAAAAGGSGGLLVVDTAGHMQSLHWCLTCKERNNILVAFAAVLPAS